MLAAKPDFSARGTAADLRDALGKEVKKDLDTMILPKLKKSPPQINRCVVTTVNVCLPYYTRRVPHRGVWLMVGHL